MPSKCVLAVIILGISAYLYLNPSYTNVIIKIQHGDLQGRERFSLEGTKFYSFQAIPYAKPPINELRFKSPVPHPGWTGILDATKNVSLCYQMRHVGQEDCLFLNVYTKNVLDLQVKELKPVLVYIHGGAFREGHSHEDLYNPEFLMIEDVVLVNFNFRVGVLGLLSIRDDDTKQFITANAAMKDQVLALKWIHDNIKEFGGDPARVTLFGQSAGAVSIILHLFSPLSKGLFHGAIVQSSTWHAYSMSKPDSGPKLARILNISETDPLKLLTQLQRVPVKDLLEAQTKLFDIMCPMKEYYGSPIVEGNYSDSFMPGHPLDLIKNGIYNSVPAMYGNTNNEGIIVDILNKKFGAYEFLFDIENNLPWEVQGVKRSEAARKMKDFYYNNRESNPETDTLALIDIVSDSWFYHVTHYFAKMHSKYNRVYFYEFTADTELNFYKRQHPITATYKGASHVDCLGYLWKCNDSPNVKLGSFEHRMVRQSINIWTNFAKFGHPQTDPQWSPVDYSSDNFDYMEIGNELAMKVNPNKKRLDFWTNLFN